MEVRIHALDDRSCTILSVLFHEILVIFLSSSQDLIHSLLLYQVGGFDETLVEPILIAISVQLDTSLAIAGGVTRGLRCPRFFFR